MNHLVHDQLEASWIRVARGIESSCSAGVLCPCLGVFAGDMSEVTELPLLTEELSPSNPSLTPAEPQQQHGSGEAPARSALGRGLDAVRAQVRASFSSLPSSASSTARRRTKHWLRLYPWLPLTGQLREDATTGLTVGVMLIPQSMAYATLAGLPPIYGLYSSLAPLLAYGLLGTSPHLHFGPFGLVSVLVADGLSGAGYDAAACGAW